MSWDNGGGCDPLTPPRPTGPQRPLTADDRAWVRQQTNGATGWTDAQLNALLAQFIVVPSPLICGQSWPAPTNPAGYEPDLWAGASMVFEYRLLALLEDPRVGATHLRDGDAQVTYTGMSSTGLLRSLIRRYWRRADRYNRELVHPSGWRTVDVGTAKRFFLVHGPAHGLLPVINGPDADLLSDRGTW